MKNVTNANRTVETELGRFEKIISAFEKYIDTQFTEIKQQVSNANDEQKN